jgi:hypothetical protein
MQTKTYILFCLLLGCNTLFGLQPDSIVIKEKVSRTFPKPYYHHYKSVLVFEDDYYSHYDTYFRHSSIRKSFVLDSMRMLVKTLPTDIVNELMGAILDTNYSELKLEHFNITEKWIKENYKKQFESIENNYSYWKSFQVDYVNEQLLSTENYNTVLKDLYTNDNNSFPGLIISIYKNGSEIITLNSSNHALSLPWLINSKKSFNPQISLVLGRILSERSYFKNRFTSTDISWILANNIYNKYCEKAIDSLAVLQFATEFSDLSPEFDILSATEYAYHGRYISMMGKKEPVFKLALQNEKMPKSVELQYFISKRSNTLYPRDSLLNDYEEILSRVYELTFISYYLIADSNRKLHVFYYDNSGMNDYLIESFNTNPKEWAKYDEGNVAFEYRHLYCGCNLRLKNEYLARAIMFELFDENGRSSIWILLPDGRAVLHHFSGSSVYKYSALELGFENPSGVNFACKVFDANGNIIEK